MAGKTWFWYSILELMLYMFEKPVLLPPMG
jgi:hypothetical protein